MSCFRNRLLKFVGEVNSSSILCFTALSDSTITLINVGDNTPTVYISTTGKSYSQWNYSTITLRSGNKLRIYGDNPSGFSSDYTKYSYFEITGSVNLNGNVQSLISLEISDTIPCDYCFYRLFYKCSALNTAPILSATTLTLYCYNSMFLDCTCITKMPNLPATTMLDYCYGYMFRGCTSLNEVVDSLPATTLSPYCYLGMFLDCTTLDKVPALPAVNLSSNCYKNMFYNCSNIETAPVLPALTLAQNCYLNMFYNCTSLNYVKAMFTTVITSETKYTTNWLYNVAPTGIFYKNPDAIWDYIGPSGVPVDWTITTHGKIIETTYALSITAKDMVAEDTTTTIYYVYSTYNTYEDGYVETINEEGSDTSDYIGANEDTTSRTIDISYTYNGLTASTTVNQKAPGVFVSYTNYALDITADNIESEDTSTTIYYTLTTTEYYTDGTSKDIVTTGQSEYTGIEKNTTTQTKWLGVTLTMHGVTAYATITQSGRDPLYFVSWGTNSTITINLTGTPTVSKTLQYSTDGSTWLTYTVGTKITLASAGDRVYFMSDDTNGMSESSSITKSFSMSGSIAAYGNVMALVGYSKSVPANCFYKLFKNCSALQSAPSLPSKIMASNCYREMFANCTSLLTAPDLPAIDLISKCYASMFSGCTNLNYIKAMFTTTPTSGGVTDKWVNGVTSTWGKFIKNSNATWDNVFEIYAIPSGWTVETADA